MATPTPQPNNIDLYIGPMAPPLTEQLILTAIPEEALNHLQADLNAAARLSIRGYINAGALKKTREKVLRAVQQLFKQHGWKSPDECEAIRRDLEFREATLKALREESANGKEGGNENAKQG